MVMADALLLPPSPGLQYKTTLAAIQAANPSLTDTTLQ
jgi:hypothetical protein